MYDESTALIPLPQGRFAIVDAEDAEDLLQYRWCITNGYVSRKFQVDWNITTEYMHRRIMKCPSGRTVDHINYDKLDNRKANLRIATPSQNSAYRRGTRTTPGYKGVRQTSANRWQARIKSGRKEIYLGSYSTAVDAARAYDIAAIECFSEFAVLNFPEEHQS